MSRFFGSQGCQGFAIDDLVFVLSPHVEASTRQRSKALESSAWLLSRVESQYDPEVYIARDVGSGVGDVTGWRPSGGRCIGLLWKLHHAMASSLRGYMC